MILQDRIIPHYLKLFPSIVYESDDYMAAMFGLRFQMVGDMLNNEISYQ
jgi:hypothetical protein